MKLGLFASQQVGLEIAKFFRETNEPVQFVVIDAKGDAALNREIVRHAGVNEGKVFSSDSIYELNRLAELEALAPDLILLAWWPYILKEALIRVPRIGCLNFHPSLLPYNRGKNYNFWTIVEDSPFGVTLHFIDRGVDSGDIAFQSQIDKSWEDTGETLYRKAQHEIVKLFKEKFPLIKAGTIPRMPQDLSKGSFHKSSELDEASRIDLDRPYAARELLNIMRARTFPPYPGAWFIDGTDTYEVRVSIKRVNK